MTVLTQSSVPEGLAGESAPVLADVLRRAAGLTGRVTVRDLPPAGDWTPLSDLAGQGFIVHLERACAQHGGCDGSVARAAAGNLFVGDVATALAIPFVSALVDQHRVLLIDPERVWLDLTDDGPAGFAVEGVRLAVLPRDPLAGSARVDVVPDLDALHAVAADSFVALLTPLVTRAARSIRRGRRGLWSETAERLGAAVLLVMRTLGRPGDAPSHAQALLDAAPRVLQQTLQWVDVPVGEDDGTVPWKRRVVCCLAYQTPTQAQQYCAACPMTPCHDTVAEMSTWLAANPNPNP